MAHASITITGSRPITATRLREHLAGLTSTQLGDTEANAYIDAALTMVESRGGMLLRAGTVVATYDSVPLDRSQVVLPYGPATSITSAETIDTTGTASTMTTDPVIVSAGPRPLIEPDEDEVWPDSSIGYQLRITYVAGYVTLPAAAEIACLLLASHLYRNREGTTDLNMRELPMGVANLIDTYGVHPAVRGTWYYSHEVTR